MYNSFKMATIKIEGLESGNESNDESDNEEPSPKRRCDRDVEPGTTLDVGDNLSTSIVLEDQPDQIHDHDESHNTSHNIKLTDFLPANISAQTLQVTVDLYEVLEGYFNGALEKCHLTENITVSELDLTLPSSYESKLQDNIDQLIFFFAKIIENICKSKSKVGRVVFPEMRIDLLEGMMHRLENELNKNEIQPQFNEIILPFSAKDMQTLNNDIVGVVEFLLVHEPKEICLQTNDINADQSHTVLKKKLQETIQNKITEDDKKPKVKLGSKVLVKWKQTESLDKTKQQKHAKQDTSKKQQKQRGLVSKISRKEKILLPKKLKLLDQSQVFAFDFQLMVPYSPRSPKFMTAYGYWNFEKIHNRFQFTGKGVTVAIVDTGISPHLAFVRENITTMNFSGDIINVDMVGHGTICAGILCGNPFQCYRDPQNPLDKRITVFPPGVAPDANLVVCKVTSGDLKTATSSAIANALKWIGNHNELEENQRIDVVSLSMGSRGISFEVVAATNRLVYNGVIIKGRYKTHDIYMVTDMPEKMKEEWPFPSFLLCGGYTDNINVWFSSGGTKSVLHSDSVENFHCVVSGRKEFIMFQPEYSERIGPEHKTLGYYHLDVTAVNMTQYPNLPDIPWYKATVNAGDCLYLPYKWLHHVDSYGRNMGVNVWWIPFEFRSEECDSVQSRIGFAKISQFPLSPELQIKHFLIEMKRPDGTIHAKDVYKTQKERSTGKSIELTEENIDELFEILLPGCNGMIREIDLRGDKIPLERYRNAMDHVGKLLEGDRAPPPPSDEFLFPDDEAPPPYPYHPPPDFNENEEGGGDGHPHARDEL